MEKPVNKFQPFDPRKVLNISNGYWNLKAKRENLSFTKKKKVSEKAQEASGGVEDLLPEKDKFERHEKLLIMACKIIVRKIRGQTRHKTLKTVCSRIH